MGGFIYDPTLGVKRSLLELSESRGIIYLNRDLVLDFCSIGYNKRIHDMSNPQGYFERIRLYLRLVNKVSRNHAELTFDDTEFLLHDVGSRNGTLLNQKELGNLVLPVNYGDCIFLGPVELQLRLEEDLREIPYYSLKGLPKLDIEKILATRQIE